MARDRFEERWRKTQESHLRPTERPRKTRSLRGLSPMQLAAERFGLTARGRGVLGGSLSGLDVKLRARSSGEETEWHATISAPDLPHRFALHAETALSMMKKSFAGEDVLTFDQTFDAAVSVHGPPRAAIAVLDHVARKLVLKLLPRGLAVRERRVELSWVTKLDAAPLREHAAELKKAASLASRMSLGEQPLAERLLKNVRRDPDPAVRLNNLALLVRDDRARLPREPVLRAVALALEQQDPLDASLARTALITMALELLAEHDFDRLSERALLALFSVAKAEAKLPIIEALGRVGTRDAVEMLLPHASGLFIRTVVKESVKSAIALIEERAGSNRGRLSVVPLAERQGSLALTALEGGLALSDNELHARERPKSEEEDE